MVLNEGYMRNYYKPKFFTTCTENQPLQKYVSIAGKLPNLFFAVTSRSRELDSLAELHTIKTAIYLNIDI